MPTVLEPGVVFRSKIALGLGHRASSSRPTIPFGLPNSLEISIDGLKAHFFPAQCD